ncbi:MAG TPA: molecular chaperone HtpG, partial [Acidiferrobacteraceae bacterium]|nr:molecular chaperone HtpG [Acidiferrobacteraceae bacterium]
FRKKNVEVLLLSDRIDEWLVTHLTEFKGKKLQSVAKGDLDLGALEDQEERATAERAKAEHKELAERIQKVLGERVKEVRGTQRLTDSPACLIADEHDMGMNLERLLKAAGRKVPSVKPILEINPGHALVQALAGESDAARFADRAQVLFDQAVLSEGGQLEDPAAFVQRLNRLLMPATG